MVGSTRARRRPPSERGFTLFELLVALTITIIGLAGLLSLHVSTVRGTANAGYSSEAIALAQDSLEELRGKTLLEIRTDHFDNIALPNLPTVICSDSTGACNGASPGTNIADTVGRASTTFRQRYTIGQISGTNLYRLRVEVYWSDDGADPPNPSTWANPRDGHRIAVEVVRTSTEGL